MKPRYLIIIACLLISISGLSQTNDSIVCDRKNSQLDTTILVFIKGKKNQINIKWKFFYDKFELQASDPTYEILSYRMTWNSSRLNSLIEGVFKGSTVFPELSKTQEGYTLKKLAPGDYLTFEDLIAQKDGKCYILKPFAVFAVLK